MGHHIQVINQMSHLDLRTSNPAHGWQLILQQKVICFIVKAPLTNGQVSTIAFDLKEEYKFPGYHHAGGALDEIYFHYQSCSTNLLDHLFKLLLFIFL